MEFGQAVDAHLTGRQSWCHPSHRYVADARVNQCRRKTVNNKPQQKNRETSEARREPTELRGRKVDTVELFKASSNDMSSEASDQRLSNVSTEHGFCEHRWFRNGKLRLVIWRSFLRVLHVSVFLWILPHYLRPLCPSLGARTFSSYTSARAMQMRHSLSHGGGRAGGWQHSLR